MWTQVQNGLPFMSGRQNYARRGNATYSLHREGRTGWVVKQYGGKIFVTNPVLYRRAKSTYNSIISE